MTEKTDTISIRVPYTHLRNQEVELVTMNGVPNLKSDDRGSSSPSSDRDSHCSLKTLILGSIIAAGVQFGWALQLSLLTPYVQTLGVDHALSSFIWLCGPITGLMVQPCVGIWSDKCHSKYGRRRPFIFVGSLMISIAVTIIGFSADIGYFLGDTKEHCSTYRGQRTRATFVFIIGFWMLDLANNTVQGPARALLADLSGTGQQNLANGIFCSWIAVGNILGFSVGASGNWHRWFPFLTTQACCEACGNLKAAFLVAVVFLIICTFINLYFAEETPLQKRAQNLQDSDPLLNDDRPQHGSEILDSEVSKMVTNSDVGNSHDSTHSQGNAGQVLMDSPGAVLVTLLTSLRHLPSSMHSVLLVMALSWVSWFPFFLFDTDWMGREINHGNPKGNASEVSAYERGVREGAFGLLLNSVVLGICSLFIAPLCRKMGAKFVWAMSNFMVFMCMAATAIISFISIRGYSKDIQHLIRGNSTIRIIALLLFAFLGFPLSITYSVPFSMTAELTDKDGGGQGLAIGVLNLSIVIPQMIVSLGAGPWDALFGGGNIPAFVLASFFALVAGVFAVLKLPKLSTSSYTSGFHGFG